MTSTALADHGKSLVTLTFNRDKTHAYLNNFNVNSEIMNYFVEFPDANSEGGFSHLKELPTAFTLIEKVTILLVIC